MAYVLDDIYKSILETTEEGRKYLEYYEKFKSKPFVLSNGIPDIDELYGGIIGLYDECIRVNKRWEQLIGSGYDEIRG